MDDAAQTVSVETATTAPRVSIGSWAFSFGPYADDPWSFERFLEFAAGNAYDGVEINGFRPHPHDEDYDAIRTAQLVRQITSRGLGISGFAPDLRGSPPGEVPRAVYLKRMRSITDFASRAGISTVRVDTVTPASGPQGLRAVEAYRQLVESFRAASQLLEGEGIRMVWEFEPGFWINRPTAVSNLLRDVDHPNFGFLFDTSHAHTAAAFGRRQGPDPEILAGGAAEFASMVAPWVRHLHLIDSDGSLHNEDTSVHMPFGTGGVDFPAVLAALGTHAAALPWWTVDYCFWPTTHIDAITGAAEVRNLRDTFLAAREMKSKEETL